MDFSTIAQVIPMLYILLIVELRLPHLMSSDSKAFLERREAEGKPVSRPRRYLNSQRGHQCILRVLGALAVLGTGAALLGASCTNLQGNLLIEMLSSVVVAILLAIVASVPFFQPLGTDTRD